MNEIIMIKQASRPHYIEEWAKHRGYKKQADLVKALEADKSLVSRWYAGSTPSHDWQLKLAELFHCERESLFRHPDEDWMTQFFRERLITDEERDRAKQILDISFPRKAS